MAMAPAMAAVSASAAGALMAAALPGAPGPLTIPVPMAVPEHPVHASSAHRDAFHSFQACHMPDLLRDWLRDDTNMDCSGSVHVSQPKTQPCMESLAPAQGLHFQNGERAHEQALLLKGIDGTLRPDETQGLYKGRVYDVQCRSHLSRLLFLSTSSGEPPASRLWPSAQLQQLYLLRVL